VPAASPAGTGALARDGGDGQGFHRDTDMRWLDDTIIAILSLGQRRPWHLRPRANRHRDLELHGATHDLAPGHGDLLVMGGRCQADWEHSVPYRPTDALGPRISLQWRFAHRRGRHQLPNALPRCFGDVSPPSFRGCHWHNRRNPAGTCDAQYALLQFGAGYRLRHSKTQQAANLLGLRGDLAGQFCALGWRRKATSAP